MCGIELIAFLEDKGFTLRNKNNKKKQSYPVFHSQRLHTYHF